MSLNLKTKSLKENIIPAIVFILGYIFVYFYKIQYLGMYISLIITAVPAMILYLKLTRKCKNIPNILDYVILLFYVSGIMGTLAGYSFLYGNNNLAYVLLAIYFVLYIALGKDVNSYIKKNS